MDDKKEKSAFHDYVKGAFVIYIDKTIKTIDKVVRYSKK